MNRVIVTGGRDYRDQTVIWDVLDICHARDPLTLLIHGACPVDHTSCDWIAQSWASEIVRIPFMGIPPRADLRIRPSAGPERNAEMLTLQARTVLAFPGGRGTGSMIALTQAAIKAGSQIKLWHISRDGSMTLDPFSLQYVR